jgi:hypothetical protein
MENMKFCSRCLLPESYPQLTLNERCVCNVCEQYDQKWKNWNAAKAKVAFEAKINTVRTQHKKVVITCSGGIDSSFAMLICKKAYDLDIVGANFNHGFVTDVAKRNLDRIKNKLDIPIINIEPDPDTMYRLYRDFLIKTGDFCTPCCQGCCRSGFIVADKFDTNTIIHGGVSGSRVEFNVLGMLRHHYDRFMKYAGDKYSATELQSIVTHPDEINRFDLISLPQYFEWDEAEIVETLRHEIGWESMPDGRTRHVDCIVAEASDYLLQKKFGFSKRWMTISANIRAGMIGIVHGRDLIREEEESFLTEPPAVEFLLDAVKLSRAEFRKIPFYNAVPVFKYL